PDGSQHRFLQKLSPGEGTDSGVFYTRDGSYLRLKQYTSYQEVEFPDGQVHRFDVVDGKLLDIFTPFDRAAGAGSSVSIEYLTNTSNQCQDINASSCWKIT